MASRSRRERSPVRRETRVFLPPISASRLEAWLDQKAAAIERRLVDMWDRVGIRIVERFPPKDATAIYLGDGCLRWWVDGHELLFFYASAGEVAPTVAVEGVPESVFHEVYLDFVAGPLKSHPEAALMLGTILWMAHGDSRDHTTNLGHKLAALHGRSNVDGMERLRQIARITAVPDLPLMSDADRRRLRESTPSDEGHWRLLALRDAEAQRVELYAKLRIGIDEWREFAKHTPMRFHQMNVPMPLLLYDVVFKSMAGAVAEPVVEADDYDQGAVIQDTHETAEAFSARVQHEYEAALESAESPGDAIRLREALVRRYRDAIAELRRHIRSLFGAIYDLHRRIRSSDNTREKDILKQEVATKEHLMDRLQYGAITLWSDLEKHDPTAMSAKWPDRSAAVRELRRWTLDILNDPAVNPLLTPGGLLPPAVRAKLNELDDQHVGFGVALFLAHTNPTYRTDLMRIIRMVLRNDWVDSAKHFTVTPADRDYYAACYTEESLIEIPWPMWTVEEAQEKMSVYVNGSVCNNVYDFFLQTMQHEHCHSMVWRDTYVHPVHMEATYHHPRDGLWWRLMQCLYGAMLAPGSKETVMWEDPPGTDKLMDDLAAAAEYWDERGLPVH